MKRICTLLCLLLLGSALYAQSWDYIWAASATGTVGDGDNTNGIYVDANQNVYHCGYYYSTSLQFGSSTINKTAGSSNFDLFLTKYNSSGVVQWAKTAGTNNRDCQMKRVVADGSGNLYTCGFYTGNLTLGSTTLPNTSSTYNDAFVARLDNSGNFTWAIRGSQGSATANTDLANGVAVDASGNFYAIGTFMGSRFRIANDSVNKTTGYGGDLWFAKFNSSNTLQWLKKIGGGSDDNGICITADANGNVYVGGYSNSSSITIGSTTLTMNQTDFFIAKYNSSGVAQWAIKGGGTNNDFIEDIEVDASGNIYVTGFFASNTMTLGGQSLTNSNTNTSGDIWFAKLSNSGTVTWLKKVGGSDMETSAGIDIDNNGNVYIGGSFASSFIDLGGGNSISNNGTATTYDAFAAKYDASGNYVWAKKSVGDLTEDTWQIDAAGTGELYMAGTFTSGPAMFGVHSCNNTGATDVYVAKIAQVIVGLPEGRATQSWGIFPNPSQGIFTLHSSNDISGNIAAEIYDLSGRLVEKTLLLQTGDKIYHADLSHLETGMYLMSISFDGQRETSRISISR